MTSLLQIAFFLSGFAALLYQVIWQRLLVIFSGADVFSLTIIVVAFMGGLGVGGLVGGRLADWLGSRASLWAFAIAELLVGAFGLISKPLYYDVLYETFPQLAATPAIAAAVLIASLLWPTLLMGLSLPLLARALTASLEAAGGVVGALYGWNTLGAATGAFVSTWLLLPRFGLEHSLWIGSAANLACAGLALLAWRGAVIDRTQRTTLDRDARDSPVPQDEPWSFRAWALIYGLAGFVALALEITWFRLLGVMLKSTAFTFGTLLGVYLTGLGLGAAFAARGVARSERPGLTFLLLQYGLTLYVALSTTALVALIAAGHPVDLVRYLGRYDPIDVAATISGFKQSVTDTSALGPFLGFGLLYLVVPAALIGPPTVLMGASFPYLQKAGHSYLPRLGRRLGILLASNIAGSVAGAMAAGWLLLPMLGTAGTLKMLVGIGAVFALLLAHARWPDRPVARVRASLAAVLVTGTAVLAMPDAQTLWAHLHGASPRHVLFDEDGAGLSLLKAERSDFEGTVGLYVNGLGQSWIPYGGIHTALGALPAFIHRAPVDVVIIGLGSGDTAFAVAGCAEVQRITSVEIIGAQLETLHRLTLVQAYPGLTALLSDPRVEHRVGDGRAYLLQTSRRFDIIEADALRPTSAYAGNLYSREYFGVLLRHLKPGGLAVTWAPNERIGRTFLGVFPYVLAFSDIVIGSNAPISFDPAVIATRAAAVRHYYDAAGIDIIAILRPYMESAPQSFGPDDGRTLIDINTDTFPRDEFALPF